MSDHPAVSRLGDDALLVTFARSISWEVGVRARVAAARVTEMQIDGVLDVVPAYTTLAVYFDGAQISFEQVIRAIGPAIDSTEFTGTETGSLIEIPVRYDGRDLAEVADRTGLSVAEVAERHSSRSYRAYMSGFLPGFAYLGDLDSSLILPRRSTPRIRVPAGSVAIAGAQTAVYPLETPGGWHLIGSTSAAMFDATRAQPALVRPGDMVRFVRIDR